MANKKKQKVYLKKIAQGILLSIIVLIIIFIYNKGGLISQFLLYETLPFYNVEANTKELFKFDSKLPNGGDTVAYAPIFEDAVSEANKKENSRTIVEIIEDEPAPAPTEAPVVQDNHKFKVEKIEANPVETNMNVIGLEDVIYQPEADSLNVDTHFFDDSIYEIDKLRDLNYLKNNFYIVDKRTNISEKLFNVDNFISADLKITPNPSKPQILVFHTHSQEVYTNSNGMKEGVIGIGDMLCKILDEKYGIKSIHDTSSYDIVDGKSQILGAYERMEVNVKKILRDNPTIEVAIDLHRDGVADGVRLINMINGRPTAQIMFFNGLSKLNENGVLKDISSLPNSNLNSNLAFSFQMQIEANKLFTGFTRKVYLNAYRYSLHMLPKSLLVEVGAQTNTKEEALNAMEPLADILAEVLLRK